MVSKSLVHARQYDRLDPDILRQMLTFSLMNLVSPHADDPESLRFSVLAPDVGEFREPRTMMRALALDPDKPETFYPLAEWYMGIPPGPTELGPNRVAALGKRNKIGRNAPCPGGSGKKYKRCCGWSIV